MDLADQRSRECGKYETIYHSDDPYYSEYGRKNHGAGSLDWLLAQKPLSVCDVGAGYGDFARMLEEAGVPTVLSVDFAPPNGKVIKASAHDLPFGNNSIEWLTAFDLLEHLLPDEVDEVLNEFNRVASRGFVFSISYTESNFKVDGEGLHPTVRSEDWWIDTIQRNIGLEVGKWNRYLICVL